MSEKLAPNDNSDFYEDDFVKVENGTIRVKLYFFPYGDKTINASNIKKIKYCKQTECYAKNWGSSSFTWWACDMKRNFRSADNVYYNFSLDTGELFAKGFTVHDAVSFLRSLRNHLVGCEIGSLEGLA